MIEIYLFIHPLCPDSLASEKRILQIIQQEQKKVQFKFLPLLNLQSFQQFIEEHRLQSLSIAERNHLFEISYSAALDYKTMQFQGKKKGRAFLLALQEKIVVEGIHYSKALVNQIISEIGGDLGMFHADRVSPLVIDAFKADQSTAKEMNVLSNASAVIFNYACDRDFGVLIDEQPTEELLHELFKTTTRGRLIAINGNPHCQSMTIDPALRLLEN
ncbi:DsbA family protein [Vagococcus salmoninarum]|uniref:DsbA family protein n=1 Tax=Vagococcus salmoninarum TaxID=2739 RepID=UPI003F9D33F8